MRNRRGSSFARGNIESCGGGLTCELCENWRNGLLNCESDESSRMRSASVELYRWLNVEAGFSDCRGGRCKGSCDTREFELCGRIREA